MGIFGWSYPPGADGEPDDSYNQDASEEDKSAAAADDEIVANIFDLGRIGFEVGNQTAEQVARSISRQLFKSTNCGCTFNHDSLGVAVSGYCEGSDIELPSHRLNYPFTASKFWAAVEAADDEGSSAWASTHGCEGCWPDGKFDDSGQVELEFGSWPVNPDCEHCGGDGVVL